MSTGCGELRNYIPRKILGDLGADELQRLDSHLSTCADCRQEEQLYAATLDRLRTAEDAPVPRHFFVYEPQARTSPWGLFRSLSFGWQAATAAALVCIFALGAFAAAGLRVRFEPGAMIVALGKQAAPAATPQNTPAPIDLQALEARIVQVSEEKNRREMLDWVRTLREEIAQGNRELDRRQRAVIETAFVNFENRVGARITETAQALETRTNRALGDLYTTVNLQRERDVTAFNDRLARVVLSGETRSNQTDVILDALLQATELRLKQ